MVFPVLLTPTSTSLQVMVFFLGGGFYLGRDAKVLPEMSLGPSEGLKDGRRAIQLLSRAWETSMSFFSSYYVFFVFTYKEKCLD